jgi:HlyD family secretion protein
MSDNALFRKAALDKLASPERLDVLMQVTSPMGWLALLTIAGILVGVIVWSILGEIPERLTGQGVLLRGGANSEIRAQGSGSLVTLDLQPNQVVSIGQVVGTTQVLAGDADVRVAETRLNEAMSRRVQVGMTGNQAAAAADNRIAELRSDLLRQQAELDAADANVKRLQELFDQKAIPASRLEQAKAARSQAAGAISGTRGQIQAQENARRTARDGSGAVESEVAMAQAELKRVKEKLGAQEQLVSRVAGRVIQVNKRVGDAVNANDVIAVLESTDATVEVIAFVDAAVGKRILQDMPTEVSPTNVKAEEFGFMLATVSSRSEFPADPTYVMNQLRNEAVAKKLIGQSAVTEVRARLKIKESTPSGFEWSTSTGPGFKIGSGTLVSIAVVVERKAPITMVMPFLRKTFGVA